MAIGDEVPPRRSYHHGSLRQALLEAGLELTRTGGPQALVLRDVTRRVGVSPNAAYRHFADRDSLLLAIAVSIQQRMAERMTDHLRSLAAAREPDLSPDRARLHAVGLGYIEFALDEPGWFEVAFAGPDALPAKVGVTMPTPAPLQALTDALDALVEAGELPAAARPGAEWPCWSAVHGFALLALHGPLRRLPRPEVWAAADRTVGAIITGLLA